MSKRKNRGGSVKAQRQRSLVGDLLTEGVYGNPAFMHAATLQVGNIARIITASGQVWEGVFKTYSQGFNVVLEVAARVENPDGPDSRLLSETHTDRLIFKACDILSMTFRNVDLDYPVKDSFQTDMAISARHNGNKSSEEKELEPWDGGQINGNDVSLDLEASNGWDVQDMFRKNEQDYGVTSTFDHSLRGYTVPLQPNDSADYREAQAKAEQIANEIENQPAYKARLELENGDEEATFAAVSRPTQDSTNGKYIPPARRKGQNNGKLVGSTPPPSGSSSSQNSPSPKDPRPPVQYPPPLNIQHDNQHHPAVVVHQNSIHTVPNPHVPPVQQQQQQQPSQTYPRQPSPQLQQHQHVVGQHGGPPPSHMHNAHNSPNMPPPQVVIPPSQIQNIAPQQQQHNVIPPHQQVMQQQQIPQHVPLPTNPPPNQQQQPNAHTSSHQYQQGPPPSVRHQGGGMPHAIVGPLSAAHSKPPQINGDIKSGPQQRQQRHYQQQQQMQERGVVVMQQGVPPGHPQGPPPAHQQVTPQYQEAKAQDPPQPIQIPQPQQQPPPQSRPPPPHQQQQHQQQLPQQVPPTTPQSQENLKELHVFSHEFKLAPLQGPPPSSAPQPIMSMGADSSSPNGSSSNLNTMNSVADQSQSSGQSQKQPSPAQSPLSSESEKLQSTLAKSKLNPNAKEFVLNPTAKPFQPSFSNNSRSPSTPSASRPHTPQTPSHSPYITAVSGPGGPPMPVMMPMHYMAISPQYQPPPPQTNRIRKIPMGQIRTDMASQMQHAAAVTGQPLLAPAPLPQFIYNPGAAAAAAHSMNQAAAAAAAYQPSVAAMHAAATLRMYDAAAAAAQQSAPTQMSFLPPQPSGTPSPAQAQYNPAAVQQQQGPPQGYQVQAMQAPQQAPSQIPMFYIPTQPHMLQNVPYSQQAPPQGPPHQHVQLLVHQQHPSQGGNPHGPNP